MVRGLVGHKHIGYTGDSVHLRVQQEKKSVIYVMVIFTKHALDKFNVFKRHKFLVSKSLVIKAVTKPDLIDNSRSPLLIGQIQFDKSHILRVVYKKENGRIKIITFYPGRKTQYEKK